MSRVMKPYYYCTFCKGNHRVSSKIGQAHKFFKLDWPTKNGRRDTSSRTFENLRALASHIASGLGRTAL